MADDKTFYCWVRILGAAQPLERADLRADESEGRFHLMYGNRPPKVVTADDRTNAAPYGVWFADPDFMGDPTTDTVFDYGPAFVDRDAALQWIANPASGQQWAAKALNHMLLCMRCTGSPPAVGNMPKDLI